MPVPLPVSDVLRIQPGDVVAVAPPHQAAWLGQVIHVVEGARSQELSVAEVVRDDDCTVVTINPEWVMDCIPGHRSDSSGRNLMD